MRIASSPTFRIAAGLRLAVLPGVVGNQVARRLRSHGQDVRLKQADAGLWLAGTVQANPPYLSPHLLPSPTAFNEQSRLCALDPTSFGSHLAPTCFQNIAAALAITEPQNATATPRAHDELLQLSQ
jgi:hypothetical protein